MTAIPYPVTKILVPYDGSPSAKNALTLAAHLSIAGREAVTGITVVQVIGGSYLARHVHNVDLRVTRMDKDKDWQRIRQRYLEGEIRPMLAEAQKTLQDLGVKAPIEARILEGKVSEEIIRLARDEHFSTIVMGRRGLSSPESPVSGERHPQHPVPGPGGDGVCRRPGGGPGNRLPHFSSAPSH
jgi:nucleotide-binding universal stress UspA family protein